MNRKPLIIALAFLIGSFAELHGQVKITLLDRARRGDHSALVEMEKAGDIGDLRVLSSDPSYAGHEAVSLFLARMGDQKVLQYFACHTFTPDLSDVRNLVERELDHIGGDFSIEVYRRWLDSDARLQPQIDEFRKGPGDWIPQVPSAWALMRLQSLLPDSAIPKATPRQLLSVPTAGSEELKEKWRVWIDSHQGQLQKLNPTATAISFDAAVCNNLKIRGN